MMKETPPTLTLEATTFNKPQLQEQLSVLEQRQEAQIALAGRSNVGKSSLVNALARRKQLAKISATPGKTRSINFYRVAPDGFSLVDLPGYGYAKCSQEERKSWAKLIEYYLTNTPTLKALALLLDCRIPPQALDRDLADFARGHGIPLLPVRQVHAGRTQQAPAGVEPFAQRHHASSRFLQGHARRRCPLVRAAPFRGDGGKRE